MQTWWLSAVLAVVFVGCDSGFDGERRRLVFDTSLERQSVDWTPERPVMLGARFSVWFRSRQACLVNCTGPDIDGGSASGALSMLQQREVVAVREGEGAYELTGGEGDLFHVRVQAPAALTLHDPLVLNQLDWPRYGVDAGGVPFPDVGEEVVVGEHASVVLDVAPRGATHEVLGSSPGSYVIATRDEGLHVGPRAADPRQVQVETGDAGVVSRIEVALPDGGLARAWAVRAASVDEVARVELVPVSASALPPHHYLVRALVTRADGGLFLEAPLAWELPAEVQQVPYGDGVSLGLTTRRDVVLFTYRQPDAGVVHVSARVGDHLAATDLAVEAQSPDEVDPPPPAPMKQGCGSVPGMALGAVVALLRLRKRR